MRNILLSTALLFTSLISFSQEEYQCSHEDGTCTHGLRALEEDMFTFVPPPANYVPNAERSVNINVVYSGFTPEAQTAFQYAVDIWASSLNSNITIIIDAEFTNLGAGVLGSAGPSNFYRNFSGAPQGNTFYPVALANSLANSDLGVGIPDVDCQFSNTFNWYYGTDGNPPGGQYDFVSVVLHELCHGLGFVGSADVSGGIGSYGFSGSPTIYDRFAENLAGDDIITFPNNSTALGDELTSNSLWWNGPEGAAGNGGNRPRLYAPGSWNSGSSFSHLNESTYPAGNANSLMTPFIGAAEAIHDPGPITLGMFDDMGWSLDVLDCEIQSITSGTQTPCDPVDNTYTQEVIVTYVDNPAGNINVNGTIVPITGSPQTVTLNGLVSDGNSVDVTAFFSVEPECSLTVVNVFTAPASCSPNPRLIQVDYETKQFTIQNFGPSAGDVSLHRVCSGFSYATLNTLSLISGSLNLNPGATVTLEWSAWNPSPGGTDFGLYVPSPDFTDPDDMLDFTQWLSAGNGRESVADAKGIWTAGDFMPDDPPFNFTGSGNEYGLPFWLSSDPMCAILSVTAGTQSPCDPDPDTYMQDIIITYDDEPAGNIVVNGNSFPVTGSPQTVTLQGTSDELPVDVFVFFEDESSCLAFESGLYTAPAPCGTCGFTSITAGTQTPCSPVPQLYYQDIILEYELEPIAGSVSVNGQSFPITGSPQTVAYLGVSDGNPVDITVFFSLEPTCNAFVPALFTAPLPCLLCDISGVTAGSQSACNPIDNTYSQDIVVTYENPPATGNLVVNGQNFPIASSPQTVVLTGLNSDGASVNVVASFSDESTCNFSASDLFTAPEACDNCDISDLQAGNQTACDPADNTYTQEVIVTYINPPASGLLDVNGQQYSISSSPQTILLTGLDSDGNAVDVIAFFTDEGACTLTSVGLFTSPEACFDCQGDFNGDNIVSVADLLTLISDYGCAGVCIGDLNGDLVTGTADLLFFLSIFGNTCP